MGGAFMSEDIREDKMVETIIDLEEYKGEELNEALWTQLAGQIKLVLGALTGNYSLPYKIRGKPSDVKSFARTLAGEKRYLEAYRQYGLNNSKTYRTKWQLDRAISQFERKTGIKYPLK